jgi:hypothetical protein
MNLHELFLDLIDLDDSDYGDALKFLFIQGTILFLYFFTVLRIVVEVFIRYNILPSILASVCESEYFEEYFDVILGYPFHYGKIQC